jgi:hypothetical protein
MHSERMLTPERDNFQSMNQIEQSFKTPEFQSKKISRKKGLVPDWELKKSEVFKGLSMQIVPTDIPAHVPIKNKRLYPQSYGIALGGHGVSLTPHKQNSEEAPTPPR